MAWQEVAIPTVGIALICPLLHHVEHVEVSAPVPRRGNLRVASYNIERGRNLDAIIERWKLCPARHNDLVLISEADHGMARTGNRHIARDFAEALGYSYAYAIEFIELTKGNRRERRVPGENRIGHIGNAILSRYPMSKLQVVRLPCYFDYSQRYMARIGSRIALVANIHFGDRAVTVANVHLENHSSPQQRSAQVEMLLEVLRSRGDGLPIIIAGDMNTTGLNVTQLTRSVFRRPWIVLNSPSIGVLESIEPMFDLLHRAGYEYRHCNLDEHTLQDRGYRAHLDWFFVKNVEQSQVLNPTIYRGFKDRKRFSDHVPIAVELGLNERPF